MNHQTLTCFIILCLISGSIANNENRFNNQNVWGDDNWGRDVVRRNRWGGFMPHHFMSTPTVSVNQLAQSVWDWNIVPSTAPVVGSSGNLAYEITVRKNANGELPTGVYTIRASIRVRLRNFYVFQNAYVILYAIGRNDRFDATDCVQNRFVNETFVSCNVLIPAVQLKGIAEVGIIQFYGITMQSYVNYAAANDVGNAVGVGSGQLVGGMVSFDIPGTVNDCAILTQTFDPSGLMPVSPSFNSVKICSDTTMTLDASFVTSKKDCRGSTKENFPRQILSNFRLVPQPRSDPVLTLNAVTNVAYLNCSGN